MASLDPEQIKTAIQSRRLRAITLDTSAFEKQGLRLESGLLEKLQQFRNKKSFQLILSDVVKNEVISHIEQRTQAAQKSVQDSLNKAKDFHLLTQESTNLVEELLSNEDKAIEIAHQRFQNFSQATCLNIINSEEFTSINFLLESYFKKKPPFAKAGKKKNEFPDAIALFALESWSQKNHSKILAVSSDKDWKSFCDLSENLILIEDLSDAISLIQPPEAERACAYLSREYSKPEQGILSFIDEKLRTLLFNYWMGFICHSCENSELEYAVEQKKGLNLQHDLEILDTHILKSSFLDRGLITRFFDPIELSETRLTADARTEITGEILFQINFFNQITGDDRRIFMGSSKRKTRVVVEMELLLEFNGNFNKENLENPSEAFHLPGLDLADFEVLRVLQSHCIHFGLVIPKQ